MGNSIGIDAEDEILRISCLSPFSFLVENLEEMSKVVIGDVEIFSGKIYLNEIENVKYKDL